MLLVTALFAQVPQGINYQTVVRNGSGAIIPNQNVNFRLSVISGSPTGTIVYVEAHPVATNSLGLVNLIIGQGTPLSGTFSAINWGSASHYLSVELDPAGGQAFQAMGTSQLMSVPYALSAGNSSTSMAQLTDVTITGVTDGQVLKWNTAQSKWLPANDVGGGTGDNWGTQTVQADNTLTGNGTSGTPLKIAQQGATNGQVLKWNGSSWLPDNDIGGGTGDNWGTQTVQTNGTLTGNGTSSNPLAVNGVLTDNQTLSINGTTLSISNGNSVTLPSGGGSGWALTGNTGTNATTNFVGTVDSVALRFRVFNQNAGRIDLNAYPYITSFGYQSLNSVLPGDGGGCSAFGFYALKSNTTGTANTAIGYQTLVENTTGYNNTANGYHSLRNNVSGYSNTAFGNGALRENTIGYQNTSIGNDALVSNTDGDNNTAVGHGALNANTTGRNNTAVGYFALDDNISGDYNTGIGFTTLSSNTTGDNNTAYGRAALYSNTIGNRNTAIGYDALRSNDSGDENIAVGYNTLYSNTTGTENVATGIGALYDNINGFANVAIGSSALHENIDGDYNISIGSASNDFNTTGNRNVAIGAFTMETNTSGSYLTCIGSGADVSSSNLTNATALGRNALANASNKVVLGNTSVTSIQGQVSFSTFSDARIKNNVQQNVPGLSFINALRPVTYNYDVDKENELLGVKDTTVLESKYEIEKISFSGFIAQEVDVAAKAVGYNFSGVDKSGELWSLRYSEFTVPLVKAVQEQQALIEKLMQEIEYLKSKIE